jgi:hypothetical protein
MKKVLIVAMALVASFAVADLSVDWNNSNLPVYDVGGTGTVGPFVEGGVIQLIWSLNGITTTTPGEYAVNDGALLPGETQLGALDFTGGFGLWQGLGGVFSNADVGGTDINTGFFFTRIHQRQGQAGDFFVDVGEVNAADWVYSATDPATVFKDNALGGAPVSIDQAGTTTIIPEPATIGLMGIAGLGMYLARRKTRR